MQSSAVIGLPDDDLGNRGSCAGAGAAGAGAGRDLHAHLAERLVAYNAAAEYRAGERALRDDAGKVRRSQLRAERLAAYVR
ncbi:MAG: hypothetical protein WDN69_31670 [Aliidongia sp.]